jgi:hypothetical protein
MCQTLPVSVAVQSEVLVTLGSVHTEVSGFSMVGKFTSWTDAMSKAPHVLHELCLDYREPSVRCRMTLL